MSDYESLYGSDSFDTRDDLYLLVFHGSGRPWGKGFDLLALVSRTADGGPPVVTPIPASVFLLAGGCSIVAFLRQRISGGSVVSRPEE